MFSKFKLIKKIFTLDWAGFLRLLHCAKKDSNRGYLDVFKDMVNSYRLRGINWTNYYDFGFHVNQSKEYRDSFLSQEYLAKIIPLIDDPDTIKVVEDKALLLARLSGMIGRGFIDLRTASEDDYNNFLDKYNLIFAKPVDSCGGSGVVRIVVNEIENRSELYKSLLANSQYLLEENLVQHNRMSQLSKHSVNTLRIGTVHNKNNEYKVLYVAIRFALADAYVDNGSLGAAFARIDDEGRIIGPALSDYPKPHFYDVHPLLGTTISGFQIPNFEEAKELALKAAVELSDLGYIGWDIAVTENGAEIIEANVIPSCDIFQVYKQLPNGKGYKEAFAREFALDL